MARTLEFYFDYGSPYSYLADTQVEAIARRAGATLVRKPMLLGGVFKSTGNASPADCRAEIEMERLRHADVGQALRRAVPAQSVLPGQYARPDARRGGGADRRHASSAIIPAMFKAMWVDGRNLNDIKEVAAVLAAAGLDAAEIRQPHPGPGRQGPAEGHDR